MWLAWQDRPLWLRRIAVRLRHPRKSTVPGARVVPLVDERSTYRALETDSAGGRAEHRWA